MIKAGDKPHGGTLWEPAGAGGTGTVSARTSRAHGAARRQ